MQSTIDPGHVLAEAENLLEAGRGSEAIELLDDAARGTDDPWLEASLVSMRQRAYVRPDVTVDTVGPDTPSRGPEVPDLFGDVDGLPEIRGAELRSDLLASALQHHGSLVVRGLFDTDTTATLRAEADAAIDAGEAADRGVPVEQTAPHYVPFEVAEPYTFGWIERTFADWVGGVLAVDAPRAFRHLMDAFESTSVGEVLEGHLGEWPVLSAKKSTLRRTSPDAPTMWHQDGAFLGHGTGTVNVWTALTSCGEDAPSLDVFAGRLDDLVETGTGDAQFNWSVGSEQVRRLGADRVVRPRFEPGDALLFDQLTLHRGGFDPAMTETRYAIESWFFAASTYPYEQIPIVF